MKTLKAIARLATATALCAAAFAAPAHATGGKGMLWGVHNLHNSTAQWQRDAFAALQVAEPDIIVVGCKAQCNAYQGDLVPNNAPAQRKPIMCFVPANLPEPALYKDVFSQMDLSSTASSDWRFYFNWSKGYVGFTIPAATTWLTSQAQGDALCKHPTMGLNDPNARMIEHHDNGTGGWGLGGLRHPNTKFWPAVKAKKVGDTSQNMRAWARIDDQPANPWNP